MKRTIFLSSVLAVSLLTIPSASHAATFSVVASSPDNVQTLSTELASVLASVNSLASSTATISILSGQTIYGLDARSGGQLKVTNVGAYHTDSSAYSFAPSIRLSKLIFQYIPCAAASPAVCASSYRYPAVTSELALNQSTNYLNYTITLTDLSTTSASIEVTDTTAFSNLQTELNNLSARIHAFLGT